jgi:hypothetical protein
MNNYDSLDDDDNGISNEPCEVNLNEYSKDSSDEDEQEEHHHLTTSKQTFQGMKTYEKINPTKMTSYFQIVIKSSLSFGQTTTNAVSIKFFPLPNSLLSRTLSNETIFNFKLDVLSRLWPKNRVFSPLIGVKGVAYPDRQKAQKSLDLS